MDFLVISQVFWPDTASTAQHLADLAEELIREGHSVTVYCSRHAYENNKIKFPRREDHKGIRIHRLGNTGFGKKHTIGRLADFASFNFLLFFKLLKLKKKSFDAMIGMTSPPLVSWLGVRVAGWKKIRFFYWVMDLQPELSIASGLVKKNSLLAKMLEGAGNYIIRNASIIIALDKYMRDYLVKRGADDQRVHVVPVWPVIDKPDERTRAENTFRKENNFGDRLVVMYSGNHSYIHPLDTLLGAILHFRNDPDFLFVFIGEGVRKKEVTQFIESNHLQNVLQLPYQPRNNIHNSLGSSDLQVVIMGESQVGYTHPNKIYGALFMGKPVLYIGPDPSHVTDLLHATTGNISVGHREVNELVEKLLAFKKNAVSILENTGNDNREMASRYFNPQQLKSRMVSILTASDKTI
jgi:colanic acid biosynthesis glycosyl transferase WcaI